jgi:hypothetical protein
MTDRGMAKQHRIIESPKHRGNAVGHNLNKLIAYLGVTLIAQSVEVIFGVR